MRCAEEVERFKKERGTTGTVRWQKEVRDGGGVRKGRNKGIGEYEV